jgi:drug/metabolite transporter (DMT)-like permease
MSPEKLHDIDHPRLGDRLAILAAALLFSTGGAAIKACSLGAWQVASFRSGIAALAILLLLPSSRRGWSRKTWIVGLAYATTLTLYVVANKLTTAANTIFLQGTAPLYILVLSPWLLKEATRLKDVVLMAAMAGGMALFFVGAQPTAVTAPDPMRGNILAALAGACWGLTIMGLRRLGRGGGDSADSTPGSAVACGNLIACVLGLPWALSSQVGVAGSTSGWVTSTLILVYLGVFQVAVAYIFLTRGFRSVGALEASLLLLVEPVLNPVWAWLLHDERPGVWALTGGTIILAATILKTFLDQRPRTVKAPSRS